MREIKKGDSVKYITRWIRHAALYSWGGNGGWCSMCGEPATHGEAFNDQSQERL